MRLGPLASTLVLGCASEAVLEKQSARSIDDAPLVTAADGPVDEAHAASTVDTSADSPRSSGPRESFARAVVAAKLTEPIVPSCPIPASSCPDRCASIAGWRFEEAKQCKSRVVVACLPLNLDGTYTVASDLGCATREDGVVFVGSGTVLHKLGAGWSGCSPTTEPPPVPECPDLTLRFVPWSVGR